VNDENLKVELKTGEIIVPIGSACANIFGLSTQVPVREIYLTSGESRVIMSGHQQIELQHSHDGWRFVLRGFGGILVGALDHSGVADDVIEKLRVKVRDVNQAYADEILAARSKLPKHIAKAITKLLKPNEVVEKKPVALTVFFDTEFTNIKPHSTPYLISIGCVAKDGRTFYGETSDAYHKHDCSDFVIATVLPLLDGGDARMTSVDLSMELKAWIEGLGEGEVIFRSDAPSFDWPFVQELFTFFGTWPANLQRKCGTIDFGNPNFYHRYQAGMYEFWKAWREKQHHALIDAQSMQFAWKYACRRGM
jgi:hypothetical protein